MTPLMNSAACGDRSLVKLFLSHGAMEGLHLRGKNASGWKACRKRFKGAFTAQEWAALYNERDCEIELMKAATTKRERGAEQCKI